ncbi:MAG: uroporphyrinogen-III synthase [Planctomycetota bacterium]|jgi:uroporphyrinogen-III synthase
MRVWVTRDEPPGGPLTAALRAAGLVPVLEPVIARRVVADVREAIAGLAPTDWLVLTSEYAIEAVPADVAGVPRVAVVGAPSRRVAEARGLRVELVAERGGAAALFAQLAGPARGTTVLYPRSSLAQVPEVPGAARVVSPVLYETVPRPWRRDVLDEIDVIAVASPSAVDAVGPVDRPFASIGPTTSRAVRRLGVEPWVESPEPGFAALARAIADQGPPARHQRA